MRWWLLFCLVLLALSVPAGADDCWEGCEEHRPDPCDPYLEDCDGGGGYADCSDGNEQYYCTLRTTCSVA